MKWRAWANCFLFSFSEGIDSRQKGDPTLGQSRPPYFRGSDRARFDSAKQQL